MLTQLQEEPKHILVVEDNVGLHFMLAEWLRAQGYVVYEATTADEAVLVINSLIGIDFVVTDVEMPGTMNGFELVHHIQDDLPEMNFIVVSGSATPPPEKNEHVVFLSKPYMFHDIAQHIKRMMQEDSVGA